MRLTIGERIFHIFNYLLLTLFSLIIVFPFWYVLVASLTPYSDFIANNGLLLFTKKISFEYYIFLLGKSQLIYSSYLVTIINTAIGTLMALALTTTAAYVLAEKNLPGRKAITYYFLITMFFNGGMIPTYITVKNLGLINTKYVLILIMAFSVFNTIIMKAFFEGIPDSLKEAAKIDGASDARILLEIVLPISKPAIATISLFYIVGYWNDFFNAMLYVNNPKLAPVQLILKNIISQASLPPELLEQAGQAAPPSIGIQFATIIIVALPMMILYPFVQKYFEKGITLGAVKG